MKAIVVWLIILFSHQQDIATYSNDRSIGAIPGMRGSPKEEIPVPVSVAPPAWTLPTVLDPIHPYGTSFKEYLR